MNRRQNFPLAFYYVPPAFQHVRTWGPATPTHAGFETDMEAVAERVDDQAMAAGVSVCPARTILFAQAPGPVVNRHAIVQLERVILPLGPGIMDEAGRVNISECEWSVQRGRRNREGAKCRYFVMAPEFQLGNVGAVDVARQRHDILNV